MSNFKTRNQNYVEKVKKSFLAQSAMNTMGINLISITLGKIKMQLKKNGLILQQQGFIHGGVIASGLDSACGFAALTLCEENFEVLTIEFKTSFFAPGISDTIDFEGRVVKSGKRVCFCESEANSLINGENKLIAKMSASIAMVEVPPGWKI